MSLAKHWIAGNLATIDTTALTRPRARAVVEFLRDFGDQYGVQQIGCYRSQVLNADAIAVNFHVDRPQLRAIEIHKSEQLLLVFADSDIAPSVFSLRDDFPFTPHQNSVPEDWPFSLCIDDRPWPEAKASWSPSSFVQRIRSWLTKAVTGQLHHPAQALEPLFYGTGRAIIVPRSVIDDTSGDGIKRLVGFVDSRPNANPNIIRTRVIDGHFKENEAGGRIVILPIHLPDQTMSGMRHIPRSYRSLAKFLHSFGIDLPALISDQICAWSEWTSKDSDLLTGQLAVCLLGGVVDGGRRLSDVRMLLFPSMRTSEVGEGLGLIGQVPDTKRYAKLLIAKPSDTFDTDLFPLDVVLDFDRQLAADASGYTAPSSDRIVLVGAGAIGSHIASSLSKRGAYTWSIYDSDTLFPHNLARHALNRAYVGLRKAPALAHFIRVNFGVTSAAYGYCLDVLEGRAQWPADAKSAFEDASFILDASASVAVSRNISDADVKGRKASVFLNPTGTAVVLMCEDVAKSIKLRDLEAQYYELILRSESLANHLSAGPEGVAYSGSCRSLSNRIPGSALSALSGLIDTEISAAFESEKASICIKTIEVDGSVSVSRIFGSPAQRKAITGWEVTVSSSLRAALSAERIKHLPNETGGVLLGILDHAARRIHVTGFISAPADSSGTDIGFERGIQGLVPAIKEAGDRVLGQVQYVGEWHSHPKGSSTKPSSTDIEQIAWLAVNLHAEGCPAVVAIIGDHDINIVGGRAKSL